MSSRKPWLAAIMSLVLPGFGQLYNAQVNRAIWFFLVFIGFLLPGAALAAIYLPTVMMLPVLLVCLVIGWSAWLYSGVDAFLVARRQREFIPRAWQVTGLYALVLVMFCFVVLPLVTNYVRQHQVQAFSIPSNSMNPTLQSGDYIFADMRYNCPNCKTSVERGDIVIFVFPNDRTRYYVKRIVGLPGDTVEIKKGDVYVNSKRLLSDPYTRPTSEGIEGKHWEITDSAVKSENERYEINNGQVFVMGDNRGKSNDSRVFGTVPLVDVVGKVRQIWFSKNSDGIRWKRIGEVLH